MDFHQRWIHNELASKMEKNSGSSQQPRQSIFSTHESKLRIIVSDKISQIAVFPTGTEFNQSLQKAELQFLQSQKISNSYTLIKNMHSVTVTGVYW